MIAIGKFKGKFKILANGLIDDQFNNVLEAEKIFVATVQTQSIATHPVFSL